MSRRLVQRSFAALCCVAAAACSVLVSTSDLSNGLGPSVDAASTDGATEASIVEGSVSDTAPGDGGIGDSSSDAPTDTLIDACPSGAVFCDDFERTSLLGSWTAALVPEGGVLEIIPGTPTGRGLHAALATMDAGKNECALVAQNLFGAPAKVSITSLVRSDTLESDTHINQLRFLEAASTSSVYAEYVPGSGLVIGELRCTPACTPRQSTALPFQLGKWHRVSLSVDFQTTPAMVRLDVDGQGLAYESQAGIQPGQLSAYGGAAYVVIPHGNIDLVIDDLVIEAK